MEFSIRYKKEALDISFDFSNISFDTPEKVDTNKRKRESEDILNFALVIYNVNLFQLLGTRSTRTKENTQKL